MPDYVIETERLGLRRFTLGDIDALFDVFSDPYARSFFPSMGRRRNVERWIRRDLKRYETYGFGLWAACLKEDGLLIGECGLTYQKVETSTELEIGCQIRADMRGRGLATEAALACMRYGFENVPCKRIVAMVHPDNVPSYASAGKVFSQHRRFRRHGRDYYLFYTGRRAWLSGQPDSGRESAVSGSGKGSGSPSDNSGVAVRRNPSAKRHNESRPASGSHHCDPRVSVVMPTHNYGRFIGEAIESVLAQTFEDFELVVVDDASTDDTLQIVAGYADERIRLLQRDECSCSGVAAINDGMAIARGDLIAVAAADDISVPERLDLQVSFLRENPAVDIVGGGLIPIDESGNQVGHPVLKPVYRKQPERYRQAMLKGVPVLIQGTMMHRKHLLDRLTGYGGYISSGDTEFLLRASRYYRFCNLREVLILCRQHGSSVTRTSGARLKKLHHRIFLERERIWVQKKLERLRLVDRPR